MSKVKLVPNQEVIIEGVLQYSSLTKQTDTFTKNSQFGTKSEYGLVLSNPVIIDQSKGDVLAQDILNNIYKSPKHGDERITLTSKGDIKPKVFDKTVRKRNGFELTSELAAGQTIQVQVRTFLPKAFPNVGKTLNAVLIEDENNIQYYVSGSSIAAFGIEADPNAPVSAPTAETFAGANDAAAVPTQAAQPAQTQATQPQQGFNTPPASNDDPFAAQKPVSNDNPFAQ